MHNTQILIYARVNLFEVFVLWNIGYEMKNLIRPPKPSTYEYWNIILNCTLYKLPVNSINNYIVIHRFTIYMLSKTSEHSLYTYRSSSTSTELTKHNVNRQT